MWAATHIEIVARSTFEIAYITDVVMATHGPNVSGQLAWSATRRLQTDGSGEVLVRAICSTSLTFGDGCVTNPRPATHELAEKLRKVI